ncbi:outer membrane protein [Saccharicrinis carchari]|uniref:Outer membrane protein n=2 Tax=Saccharicrinis carchari TaxID=1168039 RepID=A0A521CN79_SACCC|nr:outer membrane protein [Saccharicrinis carchari]
MFYILFFVLPAKAQETWTVNRCIRYALENNTAHRNYQLNVKREKLTAAQSKFDLLPSVSASSGGGMSYGKSVDQNNDYTNTEHFSASGRIGANLVLFEGFSRLNRMAYARFRLRAAELDRINHEDDLAFAILESYYDIVFYTGMVQIAKDQIEISNYNLKKTQAQVEIGLQAKSDLLQMQASLEKERLEFLLAQNRVEELKYNLWEKMNYKIEQGNGFEINHHTPNVNENIDPVSDSLFFEFAVVSPLLKKSEADRLAAEKNVAITKGQNLPSLSLNASMGSGYYETDIGNTGNIVPLKDQIDKNMSKYIGASLSIPIFGRNQQRTKVKQAIINKEQAQNNYDRQKQQLYYEVANNTRELRALRAKCNQIQKKLTANEMAYEVALKKYAEGLINIIELLTVKEQLADSKSELLLAGIQYEIKSRMIDFYKGERFWK